MNKQFINELKNLTTTEKQQTIDYLQKLLLPEDSIMQDEFCRCTKCGSSNNIKYGAINNRQRYKCKECNHTYTSKSHSIAHYSKISKDVWLEFINYEISGLPLEEISNYINLSVTTCFNLRHKLYSAAREYIDKIVLTGQTEIDASYTKINLKGTKPKNMPRWSKKRGGTSAFSGISHHKLCIVIGTDELDNCFMKIVGLGPESFEKFKKVEENFANSTLLVSDSKASIHLFANYLNVDHDIIKTIPNGKRYTTDNGNNIQTLNELCKIIPKVIHDYHGVSLRYLDSYLAFNCLKKMVRHKIERKIANSYLFDILNVDNNLLTSEINLTFMPVDLKEAYWEYNYGIFKH